MVGTTPAFGALEISPLAHTPGDLMIAILIESRSTIAGFSFRVTYKRFRAPLVVGLVHDGMVEIV